MAATNSTTKAKIEANRRNANRSTGPATPAGKSRSSQNARKHGLSATHLVLETAEERELYASLESALREAIQPHGELEELLFDQALFAQWHLRLCRIRESAILAAAASSTEDPVQNEAKLRSVDRHARRHEVSYQRAIKDLRVLQTDRAFDELVAMQNEPNPSEESEFLSPLADVMKARRACLQERSAWAKVNSRNLKNALEQLEHGPVPSALELDQL